MEQITIDEVMQREPCYSRERILEITGGRDALTALEVCDLNAPPTDLLWVLLHRTALSKRLLHSLACDFAEHVLFARQAAGKTVDTCSWRAIEVKRAWIRGKATDKELTHARHAAAVAAAAATAAYAAAAAAAATAAYAAAAAATAATAAAATAAAAANTAADADAAVAAECQWQLERVREVLQSEEKEE